MVPEKTIRQSSLVRFSFIVTAAAAFLYVGGDIGHRAAAALQPPAVIFSPAIDPPATNAGSDIVFWVVVVLGIGIGITVGEGFYVAWQQR